MDTNIDIFIYCGEKCGSSTLELTFSNLGFKVFRAHNSTEIFPCVINNNKITTVKDLIHNQDKDKIYIIDSYRNPVERLISKIFQNIKFPEHENIIDIINYYILNIYSYYGENHPLDLEYPIMNNIPFNEKYIIKKKDKFIFIKLKFSEINHWEEYLSEIFGFNISLINDNLSENKDYAELYKEVKKKFKISQSYLERIKNDTFFRKYNSVEEQKQYLEYWNKRSEPDDYFKNKVNDQTVIFNNIPNDFDPNIYRIYNPEVVSMSDFDVKMHFEFYGSFQDRIFSYNQVKYLPENFDCKIYREENKDLANFSDTELKIHYIKHGKDENRIYSSDQIKILPIDFDYNIYKCENKDLSNLSNDELKIHYINYGHKENRKYK